VDTRKPAQSGQAFLLLLKNSIFPTPLILVRSYCSFLVKLSCLFLLLSCIIKKMEANFSMVDPFGGAKLRLRTVCKVPLRVNPERAPA
jgi:hypothetical protein